MIVIGQPAARMMTAAIFRTDRHTLPWGKWIFTQSARFPEEWGAFVNRDRCQHDGIGGGIRGGQARFYPIFI